MSPYISSDEEETYARASKSMKTFQPESKTSSGSASTYHPTRASAEAKNDVYANIYTRTPTEVRNEPYSTIYHSDETVDLSVLSPQQDKAGPLPMTAPAMGIHDNKRRSRKSLNMKRRADSSTIVRSGTPVPVAIQAVGKRTSAPSPSILCGFPRWHY